MVKKLPYQQTTRMNNYDVVIVGSGSAGYTAAIYTLRAGLKTVIIEGDVIGGQLTTTTEIENFPSYEHISGLELMDKMRAQVTALGCEFISGLVEKNNFTNETKELVLNNGSVVSGKSIIIATGATAKYLDLPIVKDYIEKGGVSACAICDGFFYQGEDVVVIGAGDTACEEALFLANICNSVTMFVRSNKFRASNIMVERVLANPKIIVKYETELFDIFGEDSVTGVLTSKGELIPCGGVFMAIGHKPNTDFLTSENTLGKQVILEDGYIRAVDTRTTVSGVFAAGDVADIVYRQAITAAGTGAQAGINADRYIKSL